MGHSHGQTPATFFGGGLDFPASKGYHRHLSNGREALLQKTLSLYINSSNSFLITYFEGLFTQAQSIHNCLPREL
jgi:hypothetical protein